MPKMYGPYRHGRRWRVKVMVAGKQQRYQSFNSKSAASSFIDTNLHSVRQRSDGLINRIASAVSIKGGWVYAISLDPAHYPCRLKIGYTKVPKIRLSTFRTTSPSAMLVGLWEASASDEDAVHDVLTGRVGTSEVFNVRTVVSALASIDKSIGPRVRPLLAEPSETPSRIVSKGYATAKQKEPEPNDTPAIADLVILDVRARQEIGQKRYGTDLQANNGRDALVDAYQEAIDLAMYLRQLLEERVTSSLTLKGPR